MTDYLEALLDAQEQEENRQMLEWKRPTLPLSTEKTAQDIPLSSAEFSQAQWVKAGATEAAEKSTQRRIDLARKTVSEPSLNLSFEQNPELIAEQVSEPVSKVKRQISLSTGSLTAEIVRLRRAIRQMDIQISRPASGVDTAAGGSGTLWGASIPLTRAANYTALVDAAFARDARRYDGPLGLL